MGDFTAGRYVDNRHFTGRSHGVALAIGTCALVSSCPSIYKFHLSFPRLVPLFVSAILHHNLFTTRVTSSFPEGLNSLL